jgi:hypothetical protein
MTVDFTGFVWASIDLSSTSFQSRPSIIIGSIFFKQASEMVDELNDRNIANA